MPNPELQATRPRVPALVRLLAGLLALVVVAVDAPTLRLGFSDLDDTEYVTENPSVTAGLTREGFAWAFTTRWAANWHPLTWLSHQLDVELYGLDPAGHHATNVGLHAACAALVLLLVHAWTARAWASALVAALFALHPLRVESVAWIAERKDLLCAFFGLLALLAWDAWRRRGGALRYGGCLLAFACGLMAKPMLVTLPCLLLLLDAWPYGRLANTRQLGPRLLEKLPFLALTAGSCWMTYRAQSAGGATGSAVAFPLAERVANAAVAYGAYLRQTVWPSDLAIYYPHPASLREPVSRVAASLSAIGLLALTGLALRLRRRTPALAVGWLWFLGVLVPAIGLVQVGAQAHADRYTYLPHVGLFLALVVGARPLWERMAGATLLGSKGPGALALLALGACVVLTRNQIALWKDGETLYAHALACTERNFFAHANLGALALQRGDLERAESELRAALAIRAELPVARNNLGLVLARRGRTEEAREAFEAAVQLSPDYAEAHHDLAVALARLGDEAGAVRHERRAFELGLRTPRVTRHLAWLLATSSDPTLRDGAAALGHARRALADSGPSAPILEALAAALAEQGDFAQAAQHQRQALSSLSGDALEAARARLALYERGQPYRR